MNAARILEEEHKVILSVLDVLARVIERARREGKIPEADAHDLVVFFREYADQCHHSKEEDSLFPAMEAAGFPSDGGPTAVMRMEHAMGRKLVADMAVELKRGSAEPFCARADEFHALLSQHIKKEDHCLFPMACSAIGEAESCKLFDCFRRIEQDAGGKRHQGFLAAARSLCERYGVTPIDISALPSIRNAFLSNPG